MDVRDRACEAAVTRVELWVQGAGRQQPVPEEAISHIAGCARCQRRLAYLTRALDLATEDALTCAECEAALPEFLVAAEGAKSPVVALHLALCPHCGHRYAALQALAGDAWAASSAPAPRPDLSFLRPAPHVPTRVRLRSLIISLAHVFAEGLGTPSLAATGLKSGAAQSGTQVVVDAANAPGMQVRLTVEVDNANKDQCALVVAVDITGRGWPDLGGSQVELQRAGRTMDAQVTDAFGKVVFEEVALASLHDLDVVVVGEDDGVGAEDA